MTFEEYRQRLVEHVGGNPNAAQEILIKCVVMLSAHLARMDREAFQGGGMVSAKSTERRLAISRLTAKLFLNAAR